jgi:uncharacterized protein (DUF362 family)
MNDEIHDNRSARSKVVLRPINATTMELTVRDMMEQCAWRELVSTGTKVVLKPNLCAKNVDQIEMADTDVTLTAAVCKVLLSRTSDIVIGEADHLRHSAWEAFEATGYVRMARELGIKLVNFSETPTKRVTCGPAKDLALPAVLLEADVFITLPVLKTHSLTYFTGALKNQWGCVPQYNRILLHKWLNPMLVSLQSLLRPALAIMDGIVGMEGRGPVNGKPRRLGVALASPDAVALDATAMRLVGLDPERALHVMMAAREGLGRFDVADIEVDGEWEKYSTHFEPAVLDWAQAAMNHMSRYRWFVKFALENDYVFVPGRALVQFLRHVGLVQGVQ